MGSPNADIGNAVSADAYGNVYLIGTFCSPQITIGTFTVNGTGNQCDIFLAKYNSNGNVVWARRIGSELDDLGWSVSAGPNSVFISGGFSRLTAFPTPISFGNLTVPPPPGSYSPTFIAEYDTSGIIICATALASNGEDLSGIKAKNNGGAYFASHFKTNPLIVGPSTLSLTGTENIFVSAYNCTNCAVPAFSISGKTMVCVRDQITLSAPPSSSYLWSNSTSAASLITSPTVTTKYSVTITNTAGCQGSAVITVSLTVCESIPVENNDQSDISIFPNPAAENFNLNIRKDFMGSHLVLVNCYGQTVFSSEILNSNSVIDVSMLADGVYSLRVVNEKLMVYNSKLLLLK